jgi:quercetin dioxygenase-like cupin family protein
MNRQLETVNLDRRAVMLLGLAGASAVALGDPGAVLAQEKKVEPKTLKEIQSRIKGVSKVQLLEVTFPPGGALPNTKMDQAMICECTKGSLEVTLDDKTATMKTGDLWTCGVGTTEGVANKGSVPAVMRVLLLAA